MRRRLRAVDIPQSANQNVNQSPERRFFDWSAEDLALRVRGRPTVRRNSSPLSRLISDAMNAKIPTGSSRPRPRTRGRTRVEELDGIGSSIEAPGYGNGRSGLVNRERGHLLRVPL